jgi:hypothetical protein
VPAAEHPPWTEYVAALGSIVGIIVAISGVILAGIALYYAVRSASDAEESAHLARRMADGMGDLVRASQATLGSAIEQLHVARAEHARLEEERARRPVVNQIEISEIEGAPGADAPSGVFRIGFTNSGDTALREALLTIMVDRGALPETTTRWGDAGERLSEDLTMERWPGAQGIPREMEYQAAAVEVPRGVSRVRYIRLQRRGRFALRVKLFCADLEKEGPWVDVFVEVSDRGVTTIDNLSGEGPRQQTTGRHTELLVA